MLLLDCLHDNDRVIDDNPDREHQSKQRQVIERETKRRQHRKGANQGKLALQVEE